MYGEQGDLVCGSHRLTVSRLAQRDNELIHLTRNRLVHLQNPDKLLLWCILIVLLYLTLVNDLLLLLKSSTLRSTIFKTSYILPEELIVDTPAIRGGDSSTDVSVQSGNYRLVS